MQQHLMQTSKYDHSGPWLWHDPVRGQTQDWPMSPEKTSKFVLFFCVPALGVCSSHSEGPQPRGHMDIGSRTMYSLHLGTCGFTRVRCVLKKDTTGGKTWVWTVTSA